MRMILGAVGRRDSGKITSADLSLRSSNAGRGMRKAKTWINASCGLHLRVAKCVHPMRLR
jgi:hypothetical protein